MSAQSLPLRSDGLRKYAISRRPWWAVVLALLVLICCELFFSTRQESQVFDEAAHLFAGFEYWKHADFGVNPEHPPLVKLVAAVPLLPLQRKEPPPVPIPFFKAQNFIAASQFLYRGDADSLIMRARVTVACVFALGLAFLVLAAGYEMFDPQTALIALALLAFEPVFLANGALITTDVALACLFFGCVYTFYRYMKRPSVGRLLVCAIACGLAITAKHSGALILPTLAILAGSELIEAWSERRTPSGNTAGISVSQYALRLCAALATVALVSYAILWAFYGFRYAARPVGLQLMPPLAAYSAGLQNSAQKAIIAFFARYHLFPEAYLYGWVDILLIPGTRSTFVFGQIYSKGQWFFFPAMLMIKTTITLLMLLAFVPFVRLWNHRREILFLSIPPIFFLSVAIFSNLNLGVRHILPIYPFIILLAAAAGWHLVVRSRISAAAVAGLVLFAAVSSLHAFPNYLAYSNEAFGGPSNTYRIVTDANADWGQSLKWVKAYVDDHHLSNCWFDYNVPFVDPRYYKIGCKPLVSAMGRWGMGSGVTIPPVIDGTILISATEVEGLLWGPDVLNPYEVFKQRRPDALIGNVVLVFNGTFDVPLLAAYSRAGAAYGLLQQHKIIEAMAQAQSAVKLAPDSPEVHAALAQVFIAANRKAEGQQELATAIRLARATHPDFQAELIRYLEHPSHWRPAFFNPPSSRPLIQPVARTFSAAPAGSLPLYPRKTDKFYSRFFRALCQTAI
ncbi:MAG: phospholipid carrier-dependent glycosyltransferase [Acidobacteriaceae bacterium]|nr:phospholipid carrier-dependent glycosyltransferase [Acidobacteriaceae bacterium]